MRPGTIALHVGHMPEKASKLFTLWICRTVAYFFGAHLGKVFVSIKTDGPKLQLERFGE